MWCSSLKYDRPPFLERGRKYHPNLDILIHNIAHIATQLLINRSWIPVVRCFRIPKSYILTQLFIQIRNTHNLGAFFLERKQRFPIFLKRDDRWAEEGRRINENQVGVAARPKPSPRQNPFHCRCLTELTFCYPVSNAHAAADSILRWHCQISYD